MDPDLDLLKLPIIFNVSVQARYKLTHSWKEKKTEKILFCNINLEVSLSMDEKAM